MTTGLIDIMKRAARDENENSQPTDLRTGTVVSTSPLKVQITNVFTVPASMLIVPRHLTDYTVEVTVDWDTEKTNGEGETHSFTSHKHDIVGKKKIKVHSALKTGDKVALIRKKGGQSFYILDRI
jgi:hypothetical protein